MEQCFIDKKILTCVENSLYFSQRLKSNIVKIKMYSMFMLLNFVDFQIKTVNNQCIYY